MAPTRKPVRSAGEILHDVPDRAVKVAVDGRRFERAVDGAWVEIVELEPLDTNPQITWRTVVLLVGHALCTGAVLAFAGLNGFAFAAVATWVFVTLLWKPGL